MILSHYSIDRIRRCIFVGLDCFLQYSLIGLSKIIYTYIIILLTWTTQRNTRYLFCYTYFPYQNKYIYQKKKDYMERDSDTKLHLVSFHISKKIPIIKTLQLENITPPRLRIVGWVRVLDITK